MQVKENPYSGIFCVVKPDKIEDTSLKQAKGSWTFKRSSSEKGGLSKIDEKIMTIM